MGFFLTDNEKDELMKKCILELSQKNECIVVSAYNADTTQRHRRNTKRARILEELIQEGHFNYCHFYENISKYETAHFFLVFGNNEKIKQYFEPHRKTFSVLDFYDDLAPLLPGRHFNHPALIEDRKKFADRQELCIPQCEGVLEAPRDVGGWTFKLKSEAGTFIYYSGQILCALIPPKEAGEDFRISIGMCIPVGVTIQKLNAKTFDEALELMKNWKRPVRMQQGK